MHRPLARIACSCLLVGAAVWGCSEPDTPFAVSVTPATVSLDAIGATRQLTAKVTNEKGVELTGAIVTWTSSAPTVATVSDAGLVTAAGPGSAEITAAAGPAKDAATVTVAQTVTQVEATSGAQQTGTVNQQLPQALTVRVRDRLNNGISGVAVSFAVSADGGSVSPSSGTTDAQGQVSTTWTLGTKSGSYQVTATLSGALQAVTFDGKANPGPAAILSKVAGDNQYAYRGAKVDTLIAVRVRDQYGNGVGNHPVQFATDLDNGTPDSSIAFTDTTGVARSGWTLPNAIDTVTLRAQANASGGGALLGSPQSFTAIAHNLRVTLVTPAPVLEGQSATLDGSGFDPNPPANQVTIDGVAATVTAASANQLTVTVPAYDCRPIRATGLRVTTGTIPSSFVTVTVSPGSFLNLTPGQQTIVTNPAAFCFQFQASATAETYLIGVQSTSETHTDLTSITLAGTIPPSATSASAFSLRSPTRAPQGQAAGAGALSPALLRRLARHRAAELQQREFDRVNFETIRSQGAARGPDVRQLPPVGPSVNVGDTIDVRVATGGSCTNYKDITTTVRAKGTNLFILADSANPAGGFSDSHYNGFSQLFDDKIYPALVNEFGAPAADADGNSRIVVVVTQEVNRRGSVGFTTSCDFSARSTSNPASNSGEFFYVAAPDPTGTINNDTLSLALALDLMPSTIAHEPVHVIQFTRRAAAGGPFPSIWLAEGQAVLGEEIVGHAVENRTTGDNLKLPIMLNFDDTASTDWYSGGFVGLGLYFGWDPITVPSDRNGKIATAPQECTWLSTKPSNPGPCVGGLDPYGAPWSLLRYLSDRFYPTTEPVFQKALLDNPLNGYALVQSVVGMRMDSILAQWAAMLYVDDLVTSAAPALKMTSWDLFDIFYGRATHPSGQTFSLLTSLRLAPASVTYSSFSNSANVRAGSAYHTLVGGGNRPATAVKARDGAGAVLPSHMRYWIVRIE